MRRPSRWLIVSPLHSEPEGNFSFSCQCGSSHEPAVSYQCFPTPVGVYASVYFTVCALLVDCFGQTTSKCVTVQFAPLIRECQGIRYRSSWSWETIESSRKGQFKKISVRRCFVLWTSLLTTALCPTLSLEDFTDLATFPMGNCFLFIRRAEAKARQGVPKFTWVRHVAFR